MNDEDPLKRVYLDAGDHGEAGTGFAWSDPPLAADPSGRDIPEQVYRDAAETYARLVASRSSHAVEVARRSVADPAFRTAIESAYRAGQGGGAHQ